MKALLNWLQNRRARAIQREAGRRLDIITRARREELQARQWDKHSRASKQGWDTRRAGA